MKCKFLFIAIYLHTWCAIGHAQVFSLKSEYDPDIDNVCIQAQNQWAMSYNVAQNNLADIYRKLNFTAYHIDVIPCNKIYSSALAWVDHNTSKRYILINEAKLSDLNNHYYSHLFIIAHEFSHHKLNHFSSTAIPSLENKRQMELDADEYGASLVKLLGGSADDCKYALDQMNHPINDEGEDHPTKDKRYAAVDRGFISSSPVIAPEVHSYNIDLFKKYNSISLMQYPNGLKPDDITWYMNQYSMFPQSIMWYNNSLWVYWSKNSNVKNVYYYWNYSYYPNEEVQKRMDEGYNFEFLEKIKGGWYIVMLKYQQKFGQIVRSISKNDFYGRSGSYDTDVHANIQNGYSIQNIVDNGDYFTLLLTRNGNNGNAGWITADTNDEFDTWLHDTKNAGRSLLYCYKFIDNHYFGFLQQKDNINSSAVVSFDGSDTKDLIKYLDDGFSINNTTVDNSYIRFTLSK